MRIYSSQEEENLRTLRLLKEWAADGFISQDQYASMKRDTPSRLRLTNVFLRIVFCLFTLLSVAAAVGLTLITLTAGVDSAATGILFLFFGGACYWGAEIAVSARGFYRFGIEEALAALSVAFSCIGLEMVFFSGHATSPTASVVPVSGAAAALLIYRRFGYQYMFVAAMAFVAAIPASWQQPGDVQHLIVAGFFVVGLAVFFSIRDARRFDYLDGEFSFSEAMLWLGLYLAINLQLSSIDQLRQWWSPVSGFRNSFPPPFYWATYVLIWLIPAAMFWRAFAGKDRAILRVGLISALLTLVTNKPYLGLPRHSWDSIILGVLLIGVAVIVKRCLASGKEGVQCGFTAERLSAKDKRLQSLLATVGGAFTTAPTLSEVPRHEFGGGSSGGGGASSEF